MFSSWLNRDPVLWLGRRHKTQILWGSLNNHQPLAICLIKLLLDYDCSSAWKLIAFRSVRIDSLIGFLSDHHSFIHSFIRSFLRCLLCGDCVLVCNLFESESWSLGFAVYVVVFWSYHSGRRCRFMPNYCATILNARICLVFRETSLSREILYVCVCVC